MLPRSIAPEHLQAVTRRHPKVGQSASDLQLAKLSSGHLFNRLESPNALTGGEGLGVAAAERDDHRGNSNAARVVTSSVTSELWPASKL